MPIPFRADLRAFLTEFTERHRGVRLGQMFGLPAGYVGRRLCACLTTTPRRRRRGGPGGAQSASAPAVQLAASRDFTARDIGRQPDDDAVEPGVMYRPRTIVDARRLVPVLELTARHIAERQVEALTGVRTGKRR